MDINSVAQKLNMLGIPCSDSVTGAECTTFKTGGRLALFAEPSSASMAYIAVCCAERCGADYFIIGNGSNLLIPDEGSDKLFIRLSGELKSYRMDGCRLVCGAGASLAAASKFSVNEGFSGLEWATGIPGTVGGAIAMNASAYGGEIKAVLKRMIVIKDGTLQSIEAEDSAMGYRRSEYAFPNMTVLEAVFELDPDDGSAKERMEAFTEKRKASQPLNYPSAGSTFKRPAGHYAGALIEQAGLKGLRVGGASVSEKHAGFIINDRGATSKDVMELMELVRSRVFENSGVTLEPEVIVLK